MWHGDRYHLIPLTLRHFHPLGIFFFISLCLTEISSCLFSFCYCDFTSRYDTMEFRKNNESKYHKLPDFSLIFKQWKKTKNKNRSIFFLICVQQNIKEFKRTINFLKVNNELLWIKIVEPKMKENRFYFIPSHSIRNEFYFEIFFIVKK